MKTNFRKLSTGNYRGRNGKYYAFIFKRPHGGWAVQLKKEKLWFKGEGYHTGSLPTVSKAKAWVEARINKQER